MRNADQQRGSRGSKKKDLGRALAAAVVAVAVGCLMLWMLDAPRQMPLLNLAALAVGLLAAFPVSALMRAPAAVRDSLVLAAAAAIPLVALFGQPIDGDARWIVIGGLTVQPALVLVPVVALGCAARCGPARAVAVGLAALGCALQPDPGAAAMLAAGVAAAAWVRRTAAAFIASLLALSGLAAAVARPADLPPVPFVEGIVADAIAAGPLTAILVILGTVALFGPAWLLRRSAPSGMIAAFAGTWAGALGAALLGPYPTPVLGFGGSAVLGYLLSVACLPRALMVERDQPLKDER